MGYGRNRVIYQSEALFVGPTPATGQQYTGVATLSATAGWNTIKQLHRIQSANYSFNIDRTDVNQFGELAAIDRVNLDTPTVSLDFSYLLSNLANEQALGFVIDGSNTCVKNIIDKNQDDKNYFIRTSRKAWTQSATLQIAILPFSLHLLLESETGFCRPTLPKLLWEVSQLARLMLKLST